MRLFFELLVIGVLIYLAWDMPLSQRVDELRGRHPTHRQVPPRQAVATPAHGAWMWDPNHHGVLDRPTPSPAIRP